MKRFLLVLALMGSIGWALHAPVSFSEEAAVSEETVQLYNKKCAMCHGKDGVAKSMAAGSANLNDADWQKATSVDDIVTLIVEGKGKMKPYKDKLSDEEIKAIATYVKKL